MPIARVMHVSWVVHCLYQRKLSKDKSLPGKRVSCAALRRNEFAQVVHFNRKENNVSNFKNESNELILCITLNYFVRYFVVFSRI